MNNYTYRTISVQIYIYTKKFQFSRKYVYIYEYDFLLLINFESNNYFIERCVKTTKSYLNS